MSLGAALLGDVVGTAADYRRAGDAVKALLSFWRVTGYPSQFKGAVVELSEAWDDLDSLSARLQAVVPVVGMFGIYAQAAELGRRADALRLEIGKATGNVPSGPVAAPASSWGGLGVGLVVAGLVAGVWLLAPAVSGRRSRGSRRGKEG